MNGGRRDAMRVCMAIAVVLLVVHAVPAFAQDPFATAKSQACAAERGLRQLAGAVGLIGITACLLLGFYNKLNWRWLATGIGCSFAISTVPAIIGWAGGGAAC